jgi:hypothetical protein
MDLLAGMKRLGVREYPGTAVRAVEPGRVLADGPDGPVELRGDIILHAFGMHPNPTADLEAAARALGIPFETAGDCVEPTKVYHAIYDGAAAALEAWHLFNREQEQNDG